MSIEDALNGNGAWGREDCEELAWLIANRRKLLSQARTPLAKAQIRFELSLFLLIEMKEPMDLARCDLIVGRRRFFHVLQHGHHDGMRGVLFSFEVCCVELKRAVYEYLEFVGRVSEAIRAALSLIFLHT